MAAAGTAANSAQFILTICTGYCETGTSVSLFYRWGNWGTEWLMNMPNITHSKWQSWDLNLDLPFRISGPQTCNFSITWETITNPGLRALPRPTESETVGMGPALTRSPDDSVISLKAPDIKAKLCGWLKGWKKLVFIEFFLELKGFVYLMYFSLNGSLERWSSLTHFLTVVKHT